MPLQFGLLEPRSLGFENRREEPPDTQISAESYLLVHQGLSALQEEVRERESPDLWCYISFIAFRLYLHTGYWLAFFVTLRPGVFFLFGDAKGWERY